MPLFDASGERIGIRRAAPEDCDEFIALMQASKEFHYPWTDPPKSRERYYSYIHRSADTDGFLICERESGRIAGFINLNCIVRGHFHSTYLGYAVGAPYSGKGYMTEGMGVVTRYAFSEMGLHRVEANIQPTNAPSIALVKRCGFRKEGFSPKYLEIFGEWKDHERWALLADDPSVVEK